MANAITLARIGLVAPFALMFFIAADWAMTGALVLFVVAAASDFLDGWIARARGETSAFGAALDPIADKILVAAALLLLTRNGVLNGAAVAGAVAVLSREFLVGGLREAVASGASARRGPALPVSNLAKIKTAAQLIAVALLIAAAPGGLIGETAAPIAAGAYWIAVLLTVWTGAEYVIGAARLLRA